MPLPVLANILTTQAGRLDEVDLDSGELPLAAQDIVRDEVGLGAVEGGFALCLVVGNTLGFESVAKSLCCLRPLLVILNILALIAPQAQSNRVVAEPVRRQHILDKAQGERELFLDLLLCTEDVGVVLCERTYPREAVQLARLFIAVERRKLGVADGQLTVGVEL